MPPKVEDVEASAGEAKDVKMLKEKQKDLSIDIDMAEGEVQALNQETVCATYKYFSSFPSSYCECCSILLSCYKF